MWTTQRVSIKDKAIHKLVLSYLYTARAYDIYTMHQFSLFNKSPQNVVVYNNEHSLFVTAEQLLGASLATSSSHEAGNGVGPERPHSQVGQLADLMSAEATARRP